MINNDTPFKIPHNVTSTKNSYLNNKKHNMIGHDTPFKMPHNMTSIENSYLIIIINNCIAPF